MVLQDCFNAVCATFLQNFVICDFILPLDMQNSSKLLLMKMFQCFDVPALAFHCFSATEQGRKRHTMVELDFGLLDDITFVPDSVNPVLFPI